MIVYNPTTIFAFDGTAGDGQTADANGMTGGDVEDAELGRLLISRDSEQTRPGTGDGNAPIDN